MEQHKQQFAVVGHKGETVGSIGPTLVDTDGMVRDLSRDDFSIFALKERVKQQMERNSWRQTAEKRLKYLAGEVIELSHAGCDERRCEEALDCLWNVLAYLNEQDISDSLIQVSLEKVLQRGARP
jgi:NTP pyrophosphatase (non-canonical NTP hydrolase)